MDLALYCPVYGFYEKEADTVGRRGDFYTSVSVGGLFGELLAFQFAEWRSNNNSHTRGDTLVEAGAHDGRLAGDILSWLREHRREFFDRVEYWIVEPSPARQGRQKETLAGFAGRVHWVSRLGELASVSPEGGVRGIVFSNELLDAMPVHRLGWDAADRDWFEWGVRLDSGAFVWAKMPPDPSLTLHSQLAQLPDGLRDILPDGFTTEICPDAESWWREAAGVLREGKLLTIDYGLAAEDFFTPERSRGTLRCYRGHRVGDDLLANVGGQDLTAQVNFTAIQKAGESAGLETEMFVRQANFLTRIAEQVWKTPASRGGWTPARTRQFQTLTHPDHLGRPFRVLVQSR